MQRAVVWTRLQEHRKLARRGLAEIGERYKALRQEQQTRVESRHEPSSRDTRCAHTGHAGKGLHPPFQVKDLFSPLLRREERWQGTTSYRLQEVELHHGARSIPPPPPSGNDR